MNLIFQIYLAGVVCSLFFVSNEFIKFCQENNLDYRMAFNDPNILFNIFIDSLGSWITILFYYIGQK